MIELLKPTSVINARISLSGSKSISNRLLMLNAVCSASLSFLNLSESEDTHLLQQALQQIKTAARADTLPDQPQLIDVQHAGTDMRFLTALLSVTPGHWLLTGSERMKQRPIGVLVNALKELGADIHYAEEPGFPPLQISGKPLRGGTLQIDSSISSQFISALLLIAPALPEGLNLSLTGRSVSWPYVQMTLGLLESLGLTHTLQDHLISIKPSRPQLPARPIMIESDWSSASYWYSICALSPGSKISLSYLTTNSLQADAVLAHLFEPLGVSSQFNGGTLTLTHRGNACSNFSYDFTHCPDIAQTLAVTCFGLGIPAVLSGLATLKIKESDRILALKTELGQLGADINITSDSLTLYPGLQAQLATEPIIQTYDDHRMAMSFAPLALIREKINIAGPGVVGKSYPAFWRDLKSAGFNVNLQP